MNATKLLFIIACCYLTTSCSQHSKSTKDNDLITSNDTLQDEIPSTNGKTDIEIDPVKVSPDKYSIILENDYVRIVEYSIKPGQKDNTHTHPRKTSYVISGGTLRIFPENEKPFDYVEENGASEWAEKVGRHYVENTGNTTITILLTEIKSCQ